MMLQQTQTGTVEPYYARWLQRFPTVGDLAAADREEVLAMWAGLGYYCRAHHLHEAARVVANDLDGRFPRTVDGLMKLPGVGRYTAGAIASIAFDVRAPVLDGNVKRVLARLFAVTPSGDMKRLWELAEAILPRRGCGRFNEALMDLGATVCTPRQPDCEHCPLRSECVALRTQRVARIPDIRPAAKVRKLELNVFVVTCDGHVLLRQRPAGGLWSAMWELPSEQRDGASDSTVGEVLPGGIRKAAKAFRGVGTVQHQLTHRLVDFAVRAARISRRTRVSRPFRWVPLADDLPLPTAFRKVLAHYLVTR